MSDREPLAEPEFRNRHRDAIFVAGPGGGKTPTVPPGFLAAIYRIAQEPEQLTIYDVLNAGDDPAEDFEGTP